jgi:allophanate hydrolase
MAHAEDVDPVVGPIITAAGGIPAHALAADHARLMSLRRSAEALWSQVDAIVVPTAPTHPTIAEVAADPLGVNRRLGHFTNGTNLLDWCAAAVPGDPRADGLPGGITVLGPGWTDRSVWVAAATLVGMSPPSADPAIEDVALAVCGAHLEGQPLHHQLTDRHARLVARTTTSPDYRMVALDTTPPKPGLVRVASGHPAGTAIDVEVWALEPEAFGTFVAAVPPPLAIGTVELADGSWVKGFLCEPHATVGAEDISAFGGWRAWRAIHS